jgi:hypothetical protein
MAIKEVSLGHAGRENELLTLSSETLSFNAEFIANNNLQKAQSVKMLIDDEDPYFLGMKFFNEAIFINYGNYLGKKSFMIELFFTFFKSKLLLNEKLLIPLTCNSPESYKNL